MRMRTTWLLLLLAVGAGCRQDMHDQPRYEPLEPSELFADGTSARTPVDGTVAWGRDPSQPDPDVLRADVHLFLGRPGEDSRDYVDAFPFPIDAAALDRGQERYEIFCSMCHDRAGTGNGMVAQRGFRRPPSLHDPRLRDAPVGYFYDVITNGYGVMPNYRSQIPVRDRWRIIAYVRALQLARNATPADVPADQRSLLDEGESR